MLQFETSNCPFLKGLKFREIQIRMMLDALCKLGVYFKLTVMSVHFDPFCQCKRSMERTKCWLSFFFFYIVTGCNEIIVLNPKISPVIVED